MIKLLLVTALIGAIYAEETAKAYKCMKSPDTDGDPLGEEDCTAALPDAQICKFPKFVITTGDLVAAAQKYGCGACDTANTEPAAQCATCKGDKCNVKVETVEFKCPTYAANEAGDAFEKGEERSCFKTKGTHGECNTPGSEATVEAGTKHWEATDSGCGACAKDKADANICKTVSSAMGLSALLLPLVAAIYTLF